MNFLRRTVARVLAFDQRVEHAFSLWAGYGYSWRLAWRIAGTWQ